MSPLDRLRLRPQDRRAIKLGVWIAGPVLFLSYAVRPYVESRNALKDEIESERAALSQHLRLIADGKGFPGLEKQVQEGLNREATRLFDGPNEASATASLLAFVMSRAKEAEVLVQETSSRQADSLGNGIERLAVEVRGVSDLEGILQFLAGLEGGGKLISVEEIQLERREGLAIPPPDEPSISPASDVSLLSLSAVVSAYAAGEIERRGAVTAVSLSEKK